MKDFTVGQKYFYAHDGATIEVIGIEDDRAVLGNGVWVYRRSFAELTEEIERAGATRIDIGRDAAGED